MQPPFATSSRPLVAGPVKRRMAPYLAPGEALLAAGGVVPAEAPTWVALALVPSAGLAAILGAPLAVVAVLGLTVMAVATGIAHRFVPPRVHGPAGSIVRAAGRGAALLAVTDRRVLVVGGTAGAPWALAFDRTDVRLERTGGRRGRLATLLLTHADGGALEIRTPWLLARSFDAAANP